MKIVLVAIGNSSRSDDGLGWAFAELVENHPKIICDVEYRYQLQVEDADFIANYDTVFFVDAFAENIENGFEITEIFPAEEYFFSSHLQSPEAVLYLNKTLYQNQPKAYLIKIQGKDFELKDGLSDEARENLQNAFERFEKDFCFRFGFCSTIS